MRVGVDEAGQYEIWKRRHVGIIESMAQS
jgi:hypothetical protein